MIASRKTSLLREIDFTREIPLLIAATLEAFDKGYRTTPSRREDPISRQLVFALLRLQSSDGWEWFADYVINGQQDELDAEQETHLGRTDITFELGSHHRFIWECKRLHFDGKTLYGEYRKEGVARYISNKYAKGHDHGGMLAFVMDGKIGKAVAGLEAHLAAYRTELEIEGKCFLPCIEPKDSRLRLSLHFPEGRFKLFHCFLPV
jgi:hypothetical protein